MRRSAGIVAAVCALGARAIVLPSSFNQLSSLIVAEHSPQNLVVELSCSQCAFSKSNLGESEESVENMDDIFTIQGGSHSILVNYTVSEDGLSFGYSGRTMVPLKLAELGGNTYVHQVSSRSSIADGEVGLATSVPVKVTMDYWWSLEGPSLDSSEAGSMQLGHYISELNGQSVSLSEVKIHLLRDAEGRLTIEGSQLGASRDELLTSPWRADDEESYVFVPAIGEESVDDVPAFTQGLDRTTDDHEECGMPAPLCRFKAMIASKIDAARRGGCSGRKGVSPFSNGHLPTHIRPHLTRPGHDEIPRPRHGRPHYQHRKPNHGHGQRHRHHFLHAFARGLAVILIPTLAGVAVGMTASLVGLIVGRLIGFLWIQLVRGGRRGEAGAISLAADVEEFEPEKESLVAEMEAPPVYEVAADQKMTEEFGREEQK